MKRKHALPLLTIAVIAAIVGCLALAFSPAWVAIMLIRPSVFDGLYVKAGQSITRKVMHEVMGGVHARA